MKKLNLKQSSSDSDVTMVMLYNTTENIIEELLDVSIYTIKFYSHGSVVCLTV